MSLLDGLAEIVVHALAQAVLAIPVSALAVRAMIGVRGAPVSASNSRISLVAAKPSMIGISQSIRTASNRRCGRNQLPRCRL